MKKILGALFAATIIVLSGCALQNEVSDKNPREMSITVKNITPRTLFAATFVHMKTQFSSRWRWHKSAITKLPPETKVSINVGTLADEQDKGSVYGVLGVFTSEKDANDSIYELLADENKLDLDQISKLHDQTVIVGVEKYGITGDIFDYDFISNEDIETAEELDFVVENQTGRNVYAMAFIYQIKEDMPTWRYDKTPIIYLPDGSSGVIDVDTLTSSYDRKYMRGYLAVFDEAEKDAAQHATYELLKPHHKLNLGRLSGLKDRKVIINEQKYGIMGDMIDFTVKKPKPANVTRKSS